MIVVTNHLGNGVYSIVFLRGITMTHYIVTSHIRVYKLAERLKALEYDQAWCNDGATTIYSYYL